MSQDDHYINGELLRLGREARGWVLGDMATRACMSVKQIRQLEEGGTSAFYSPAVKMTSAKKLAGILELLPEQVFHRPLPVQVEAATSLASESEIAPAVDQSTVAEIPAHEQPEPVVVTPHSNDVSASPDALEEPKAKTPVWIILALFVAALGVAGYMQQQEEPATEPPPPLQVVPGEADAAASAADAPASGASGEQPAAPVANSAAPQASGALPQAIYAAPAATAAVPSTALAAPRPAASAASKPL